MSAREPTPDSRHCFMNSAATVKLLDLLQGKWLGHPLHPALVHIPVGAWITAAVIDIIDRKHTTAGPPEHLALYCVIAGLAGALIAVPPGIADWTPIKREKPAWKLGLYHMSLNLLAAIIWAANLGLRWNALHSAEPVTTAVLTTAIVGAVVVIASSYLGCLMVFDQGVSVARQSKKKWRTIAQRGGAKVPESK